MSEFHIPIHSLYASVRSTLGLTSASLFPRYVPGLYFTPQTQGFAIKVGRHSSFCHIHSSEICRSRAPLYAFRTFFDNLFLTTVTTICFLREEKKVRKRSDRKEESIGVRYLLQRAGNRG